MIGVGVTVRVVKEIALMVFAGIRVMSQGRSLRPRLGALKSVLLNLGVFVDGAVSLLGIRRRHLLFTFHRGARGGLFGTNLGEGNPRLRRHEPTFAARASILQMVLGCVERIGRQRPGVGDQVDGDTAIDADGCGQISGRNQVVR